MGQFFVNDRKLFNKKGELAVWHFNCFVIYKNQMMTACCMDRNMEKVRVDKTLDIKGISSPRLQELTVNTMESMYSGQVLRVITDDSSTRTTIPALCNKCGYVLMETGEYDGALYYTIRK